MMIMFGGQESLRLDEVNLGKFGFRILAVRLIHTSEDTKVCKCMHDCAIASRVHAESVGDACAVQ